MISLFLHIQFNAKKVLPPSEPINELDPDADDEPNAIPEFNEILKDKSLDFKEAFKQGLNSQKLKEDADNDELVNITVSKSDMKDLKEIIKLQNEMKKEQKIKIGEDNEEDNQNPDIIVLRQLQDPQFRKEVEAKLKKTQEEPKPILINKFPTYFDVKAIVISPEEGMIYIDDAISEAQWPLPFVKAICMISDKPEPFEEILKEINWRILGRYQKQFGYQIITDMNELRNYFCETLKEA